jgi:predicted RNase H-like nuclease (RuvC/YqgF family)
MKQQVRDRGRRVVRSVAPTLMKSLEDVARLTDEVADLRQQVTRQRRRIEELEQEVTEARRLNRRIAELTDVVQELLVPLADRDDERLRERLDRYADTL